MFSLKRLKLGRVKPVVVFSQLAPARDEYLHSTVVLGGTFFVVLVALLTLLYSTVAIGPTYLPKPGEIAIRNVKADRDILIEDDETTNQRRAEAALSTPQVYDWDSGLVGSISDYVSDLVKWLVLAQQQGSTESGGVTADSLREKLARKLEDDVPPEVVSDLLKMNGFNWLAVASAEWLSHLEGQRIVSGQDELKELKRTTYVVRPISGHADRLESGGEGVIDLHEARRQMTRHAMDKPGEMSRRVGEWLLELVQAQLRPNLVLNITETKLRQQRAMDVVGTAYFKVRRGELLVAEGTEVTAAAFRKMEAMSSDRLDRTAMVKLGGLATIVAIVLWLGGKFLRKTSGAALREQKNIFILGTVLGVVALLGNSSMMLGKGVAQLLNWQESAINYLPPVALAPALISLFIGSRVSLPGGSLVIGSVLSFLTAFEAGGGLPLFIYFMVGSLVGGYSLRSCRHRLDVLKVGVRVGLFQAAVVPVVEAMEGTMLGWESLRGASMAASGGLLVGLFGLALIPLLEWLFNVSTDSHLLELASGDHPLLKQLSLQSPGTYYHSIMMGNLAEAAAEAIGANPLLARVMALYHDIGKMEKSQYFIENQSGVNRHDLLTPSMSVKVIVSHVKEGVELAKQYNLGGPVLEAITQHHGTTKLQFFYNKAVTDATKRNETVMEDDFRYPGPKPQTREAGILMLADSVEAAARTLRTPSPAQIQALVRRITASKIEDGQFDECRLTLRDLATIEDAFFRVLTLGFYHRRISYPDQDKSGALKSGGTTQNKAPVPRMAKGA